MPDSQSPPDTELMSRLGRALAPAYEIEGELGRGGMAIVYRARDARLKRGVAVKVLPPEMAFRGDVRSRFLREAEMAAKLSHPNIVPIYSVDEREGLVYFVMTLVRGGSVGDRLKRGEKFSADETRRIMREVADALAYAHRLGVVHRDIKPDNILLDADSGRAMVTDFGIARAASDDGDGTRLTATGAVIGTPAYMSPEQCAGDREVDGRSDLYSLGTVAYQMLTGQPPFAGTSTPAIMVKHVTEVPLAVRQRQPDVPKDLDAIVMRLLEKEPARRFATGQALVAALDGDVELVANESASSPPVVPKYVMDVEGRGGHGVPPVPGTLTRKELRALKKSEKRARTLPDRVRKFRGDLYSYGGTSAMLFGINYMTGLDGHWWFVYPVLGMMLAVAIEIGSFVGEDNVPLTSLFRGPLPQAPVANAPVDEKILEGPHGNVMRQAIADRRRIQEIAGRLSVSERQLVPDVMETADALYARVESMAHALRQFESNSENGAERVAELDARIAELERGGGGSDRERKLGLLRRQREMVAELATSHDRLVEQYESAGLLLQNLSLDLLKVRSLGLNAAAGEINNATQQARALSKEIGYALSAAEELRRLERR